jgi:hypothetical protein
MEDHRPFRFLPDGHRRTTADAFWRVLGWRFVEVYVLVVGVSHALLAFLRRACTPGLVGHVGAHLFMQAVFQLLAELSDPAS